MVQTVLVIGASGQVGSGIVQELDADSGNVAVRLSTSRPQTAQMWQAEGRDVVLLDLARPETFAVALKGVDRIFLLTGYTAEMLYQSKMMVDAAVAAGVSHIVHLGVFHSGHDRIPHFAWHEMIETYIKASGVAWTNIHPNVIWGDKMTGSIRKSGVYTAYWQDAVQGFVCAEDIAAVAAAVLREGPAKHAGADYWLSTEVLTGSKIASILSNEWETKIVFHPRTPDELVELVATMPTAGERLYMESAVETMREAVAGRMTFQTVVRDDVQTVLGRPGITIRQWAQKVSAQEK